MDLQGYVKAGNFNISLEMVCFLVDVLSHPEGEVEINLQRIVYMHS
jgi:hypothetical protein